LGQASQGEEEQAGSVFCAGRRPSETLATGNFSASGEDGTARGWRCTSSRPASPFAFQPSIAARSSGSWP
jgi:hypothetical protein